MALSGSSYTSFARHRLVIEWSASQSVPNNHSTVTARVYLQSMDGYGAMYAPATNAGSITVNGVTQNFTANSNLSAYQKKPLATRSFNVPHNADGTKSFSFSVTYNINVTFAGVFYGNRTASGSSSLNTIPRASTVKLSSATVNLGTATTISIARASGSFTHTLIYKIGSYSKVIANKTSAVSVSYTPEIAIANQFRSSTSGWGNITCETYSGNTRIGTSSVKLTVRTVANETFNPTISGVALSETAQEVTSAFGAVYLQNRSRIRAITTSSQKYGAGIKSVVVTIGNATMTGTNVVSGAISVSGTVTVKTVLTDTRGYTATHTQSITILPYANPKIESFTGVRRPTAQEIVDFNWKASTVAVQAKNTMGYKLEWKKNTTSAWTVLASGSNVTQVNWSGTKEQAGADVGSTYDVRLTVYDKLMSSVSTFQIATATVPMSWGKEGSAIGKVYEEGGATFQVRGSGYYEGLLTTAPDTFANQGGSLNLNNSDMVGLNGIFFGATHGATDPANNDGEGLLFPHSKTVIPANGLINRNDGWDTFRVLDGTGYLNGAPMFTKKDKLWEGVMSPIGKHVITPSIPIRNCPNGWMFVWSGYSNGTIDNSNFMVTFSHKQESYFSGGSGHVIGWGGDVGGWTGSKYLYVKTTTVAGHDRNNKNNLGTVVLRWIYAW